MSNTNQATVLGINAFNAGKQAEVEAKAKQLIGLILGNQKSIKCYGVQIKEVQVSLNELALDVVDQNTVVGAEFSTPLNPNQVTILNSIKKLNDERQASVSVQSQGHINRIKGYQATIAALNKQITEWREELSKLAADTATVEGITGA